MTDILMARPEDRMRLWRDFRHTLSRDRTDMEHLEAVARFWAGCPQVDYYIDWDRPDQWPGPWEILHGGQICPTGLTILMAHSLLLAADNRWAEPRIRLRVVRHREAGYLTVAVVDDRWVLNYDIGKVAPIEALEGMSVPVGTYRHFQGKYIAAH